MFLDQGAMCISTTQFVILGVAAFALTGLLTWPVRALAIRLGAMDAPNLARKTQAEPVPYLGGVAIAIPSPCGCCTTTVSKPFSSAALSAEYKTRANSS